MSAFFLIGILCGMMTSFIGAGVMFICIPFMLKLGFPKETGLYTSLLIEIIARFANTVQFVFNNNMMFGYIGWMTLFVFIGALVGTLLVQPKVKKYGVEWVMYIIIAICLFGASILNTVTDLWSIMGDFDNGIGTFYIYEY